MKASTSPPRSQPMFIKEKFISTFRSVGSFTLIELLMVAGVMALLAGMLLPAIAKTKEKAGRLGCLGNLKQWGLALHLYALENDDYFPEEGSPTPRLGPLRVGWYVSLPRVLGTASYDQMAWRSNAELSPGRNLFICPANPRRATNNNLFHYCLNGQLDGTGENDQPTKISSLREPEKTVYLFDNGKRAAVAQQNNVHTNLHQGGAHFLLVDGHSAHFKNNVYWDFAANRGRRDHPGLLWEP